MFRACIIILLSVSFVSAPAQQSSFPIDKLAIKNIFPNLSYIPAKTFTSLAYKGNDTVMNYRARNSSVMGFYISRSEVTNREYRQFTQYIKDSIGHFFLQHFNSDGLIDWSRPIDWKDKKLDPM